MHRGGDVTCVAHDKWLTVSIEMVGPIMTRYQSLTLKLSQSLLPFAIRLVDKLKRNDRRRFYLRGVGGLRGSVNRCQGHCWRRRLAAMLLAGSMAASIDGSGNNIPNINHASGAAPQPSTGGSSGRNLDSSPTRASPPPFTYTVSVYDVCLCL